MNIYRFFMAMRGCFLSMLGLLLLHVSGLVLDNAHGEEALLSSTANTWQVALDGSGQFTLIQEAIDQATAGDTILIKAGTYAEDVTVHSKDRLRIIGEGIGRVFITGEKRVGSLHIGKWPYGATNVTIQGMTVSQHGGLGVGIFNGSGVHLKQIHVKGMIFSQQVQDVHIEDCIIEHSETTGVAFANSSGMLVGNTIRHHDHGIAVGGNSEVTLRHNVISDNLFEAVLMTDQSKATVIQNTFVRNGGGLAFHDKAEAVVRGNIIGQSKVGFLFAPESHTTLAFNALYDNQGNYLLQGTPHIPIPQRAGKTDVSLAPGFVNPQEGDFHLRQDSSLLHIGEFSYLGALPPLSPQP
jgi:parallel beta-helix repeat protein